MHVVVHNAREVACRADDDAKRAGRTSEALENCGVQLQRCFAAAVQGAGAPPTLAVHPPPIRPSYLVQVSRIFAGQIRFITYSSTICTIMSCNPLKYPGRTAALSRAASMDIQQCLLRKLCSSHAAGMPACAMLTRHACACMRAGNKAKKLATLEIIITLFKVYFRLNTLRLCKNLINAVNSRQFLPFDSFPASQRVTFKYYTGRLAIFDENYVSHRPATPACRAVSLLWKQWRNSTLFGLEADLRSAGPHDSHLTIVVSVFYDGIICSRVGLRCSSMG